MYRSELPWDDPDADPLGDVLAIADLARQDPPPGAWLADFFNQLVEREARWRLSWSEALSGVARAAAFADAGEEIRRLPYAETWLDLLDARADRARLLEDAWFAAPWQPPQPWSVECGDPLEDLRRFRDMLRGADVG